MKYIWQHKGLVHKVVKGDHGWVLSHAMLPTFEFLNSNTIKIYFGSRNEKNQSHILALIYNLEKLEIIQKIKEPLLSPGKLGTFDDNGVLPSSIITISQNKYMYYIGFKPGGTTRMDLFGGIAQFKNDRLERLSEAPIIERCKINPYINTAPFVIENINKTPCKYFMYYVAGCEWINKDLPKYNIQIAYSNDGINWIRNGDVCIDFKDKEEVALARPYVIYYKDQYHMWFSYKGGAYNIGYATSSDGIKWDRQDESGGMKATGVNGDFDSEMIAYGCVVPYKKKLYMFYNGNNYGYDGIGLAIADA